MGEIADAFVERMIFGPFGGRRRKQTFQSRVGRFHWRAADGSVLDMRSMTTAHLQNAANVCRARSNTGKLRDIEAVLAEREKNFFDPVDNS